MVDLPTTLSGVQLSALEANLARTAVEVVVPPEHAVLLEITAPWKGVHDATDALLRELHHPFAGWPQALADLHRRALGDFYYYNEHERGPEALAVLSSLYATVVREGGPAATREDGVRLWLYFLEHVAGQSGERTERNVPALQAGLAQLRELLDGSAELAVVASARLKKLAEILGGGVEAHPAVAGALEEALGLAGSSLARVYEHWLAGENPSAWFREIAGRDGVPEAVARISHDRVESLRGALERLRQARPLAGTALDLVRLPDESEIAHGFLAAADAVAAAAGGSAADARLARVHWLLKILGRADLSVVHEEALRELTRSCVAVLGAAEGPPPEAFLREVFGLVHGGVSAHPHAVLGLISRVGREVLATGDPDLVEAFVDEVLSIDFQYPEFSGFTTEWGVRVNPAHIDNIRAYLAIVEVDLSLAAPLLAALVVHLKLGGVFVTDTDLFQRDISALLARPIKQSYVLVKHLLELFPVYFNVIGAEGELRDVSTRLDEITARRDSLCHFLRKQCHVECNPQLLSLIEEIALFWATGDPAPLRAYLPDSVFDEIEAPDTTAAEVHRLFAALVPPEGRAASLFELEPAELERRIAAVPDVGPEAREKGALLVRLWHEIRRKYELDPTDVVDRLRAFRRIEGALVAELEEAMAADDRERALWLVLEILEQLQDVILSEEASGPIEDIYFKRHIAVGIPSMYGSYREDRFEAMGLTFRLEALASALLEHVIDDEDISPIGEAGLRKVARWLHFLLRAVRIDGFRAQGLAHSVSLLDEALATPGTTLEQYANIFQLISRSIEALVRARILDVYEVPAERIVTRMLERGIVRSSGQEQEDVLRHSEALMRNLIAGSFGLQRLDLLVGRVIRALDAARAQRGGIATAQPVRPDLDRHIVRIDGEVDPSQGILSLGNKGFMLRRLTDLRFPVPKGFILTTEFVRARAGGTDPVRDDPALVERIRLEVDRLARHGGTRFGDPSRPLLLSVRGGAPISMPGLLESFLNVGMNVDIAEGLAAARGSAWAAWDAYRRFLQFWGMNHGMERDGFTELISEAKRVNGVPKKALLPPDKMRELALAYREFVLDAGVRIVDEPFEQLLACIELVQRSWDADSSLSYRRELKIAEEWGTAVIVQSMVFGNLGPRSGTGVVLTRHPGRSSESLRLWGDFVIQDQGDDVVSGLVETFPITEQQRLAEARGATVSLEKEFPRIHAELDRIARSLVQQHGMNHQEIEFTFEGDDASDLYILQMRDTVVSPTAVVATFEPSAELERARLANGIGVSGGALSGRVAHTAAEIASLKEHYPDDAIILLRPDTVPDDIPLVLEADGLLTALGGATSHAAVAAKRLGKTCVVGCRSFVVDKRRARSSIGGRELVSGDVISINGIDGSVYFGAHPVTLVRVLGRS